MIILCKIRWRIQIHIRICIFDTVDQCMVNGSHLGEVCTHNSQWLLRTDWEGCVIVAVYGHVRSGWRLPTVVRSCRINIWDWYYTNGTSKLVRVEFDARSGGAFSLHPIPVLFAGRSACDSNYHTKQPHIGHVRYHHFINIIILTFELLLPDINLRPSRTKMTPQTSNVVPNRQYFDVLAVKLLLLTFFWSPEHSNKAKSANRA